MLAKEGGTGDDHQLMGDNNVSETVTCVEEGLNGSYNGPTGGTRMCNRLDV
jgi:hypothetical protein